MTEEDKDVDVESDEVPEVGREATATTTNDAHGGGDVLDKRAHHNALERRRRDHIKDSFHGLRDCIPAMEGEKVSRAHILNKATEYIRQMQKGGLLRECEISELKQKNEVLEEQVHALEQAKALGSLESSDEILHSVSEQIQTRQQQQRALQLQQPPRTHGEKDGAAKPGDKAAAEGSKNGGKTAAHGAASVPRAAPATSAGEQAKAAKASTENQQNPFNLFANNLKSAQSLLSVLQKTTGGNLPANVKSLAARVLASPLRPQVPAATQSQTVPRGIVTATTVSNQASLPTNLAGFLQKQISSTPPGTTVLPKSTPASQPKATASAISTPATTSGGGTTAAGVATPTTAPASTAPVTSPPTTNISTSQTQQIASSLLSQTISSQLMAANTLLKQSSAAVGSEGLTTIASPGGTNTVALPSNPQLAATELLAQVTSILAGTGTGGEAAPAQGAKGGGEGDGLSTDGGLSLLTQTLQNTVSQEPKEAVTAPKLQAPTSAEGERDEGKKRVAAHEPEGAEMLPKKPRIEQ